MAESSPLAPVTALRQFEISFYADRNSSGSNRPLYVVSYGLNPVSGEGYVYLFLTISVSPERGTQKDRSVMDRTADSR
jgi:hypothetical protein